MKRLFFSLMLLSASCFAMPYNPVERMPGSLSFRADWIFFSPTSESVYYATTIGGSHPNTRIANRLDKYQSGYRLGAAYAFCHCNSYFSAMWTDLMFNHENEYTGAALIGNAPAFGLTFPAAIFSSQAHDFHFHSLDLIFGQKIVSKPCIDLDIFAGVQYGWFISKDHFFYRTALSSLEVEGNGDFWGWGPQIGISAEAPLWHSFNFTGTLSSGLLIGKPHVKYMARLPQIEIHEANAWRTVPFIDCGLGISYDFCINTFQCLRRLFAKEFHCSLEAGYEAVSYFDALATIRTFDVSNAGNVLDVYRNVTMHGPYVAIDICY